MREKSSHVRTTKCAQVCTSVHMCLHSPSVTDDCTSPSGGGGGKRCKECAPARAI